MTDGKLPEKEKLEKILKYFHSKKFLVPQTFLTGSLYATGPLFLYLADRFPEIKSQLILVGICNITMATLNVLYWYTTYKQIIKKLSQYSL